jgi:putative hydrolase of the HAD superfamily
VRRALLVDIDDTVVDWISPATDAVIAAIATHPAVAGADPAGLARRFLEIVEETHVAFLAGELTMDEVRAQRIVRLIGEHGTDLAPDEAIELAAAYRAAYLDARRPVEGAPELLAEVRARGIRVVAVTNNVLAEQEDKLGHLGLRDRFDALVVSETVGVTKPDPRIFAIALEAAGCAPADAVMLGDSWVNDVRGALDAGIGAAWLNRRGIPVPEPEAPVLVLDRLSPASDVADRLLGSAILAG